MVNITTKKLTKVEFWALADAADITYELIDGEAEPKSIRFSRYFEISIYSGTKLALTGFGSGNSITGR
jgi:hypothetical protein